MKAFAGVTLVLGLLCIIAGCVESVPLSPDAENGPSDGTGSPSAQDVRSTFGTGSDGWKVTGGDFDGLNDPQWNIDEGYIKVTGDTGWYWVAPEKFYGDFSAAYGKTFSFDQFGEKNQVYTPFGSHSDKREWVIITGGGYSLYYTTLHTSRTFTNYSVRFLETDDWFDESTNNHATKAQILAVLKNLSQIKIRGVFTNGGFGGLDNVVLKVTADPESQPHPTVTSTFDTNDDGWKIQGGEFTNVASPSWNSGGGYITIYGDSDWFWIAPAKFHGDFSAAYGKTLSFDQFFDKDKTYTPFGNYDERRKWVVINGGGYSLYYTRYQTTEIFTHYAVRLLETEDWFDETTDNHATKTQMMAVLKNLSQVKIKGVLTYEGSGGLDNVVLGEDN